MKIFNLFTVAVSVLFSVSPLTVSVNSVELNWGVAISQFTGESVGTVSRYEKTENTISFVLNGEEFNFFMNEIDIPNNMSLDGGRYYSGESGDLTCNMVEYNAKTSLQVMERHKSLKARSKNPGRNFTIVDSSADIDAVNSLIDKSETNAETYGISVRQIQAVADATIIPYVLSAGYAQAYAKASITGSYAVLSSVTYTISAQWPSDGISIWKDDLTELWHTPANPPSGMQALTRDWSIPVSTGNLLAQASFVGVVTNLQYPLPIIYTKYDAAYADGRHEH